MIFIIVHVNTKILT